MWYHVWYHTVISQLCDIIVQNLWYHMWNHKLQLERNTSCVISHSFFHITPWYHIWYHSMISHVSIWHHIWYHICDITYDITHDITISVISHMISHPGRQLKRLPPRRRRQVGVQEDQPLPRRRSPSSWSSHHRPPPRRRRRPRPLLVSTASAASGAVAVALPLATGPRASTAAALLHSTLHSLQYCCTAGSSQCGMLKMQQIMCKFRCKREMAQINQTRDNLKTEYQSINIVQWKISTDFKCLTSVERGGESVFWNSDLMKQIVMCKGLLDRQRHPENGYHFVDIIQWKIELIQSNYLSRTPRLLCCRKLLKWIVMCKG